MKAPQVIFFFDRNAKA
jgi:hypothetical protein